MNNPFQNSCRFAIVALILLVTTVGCEKEEPPKTKEQPKLSTTELTVEFTPYFNNEVLEYNKMKYIIQAGDTLNFGRNRMILSNIKLELEDGTVVDTDTFALIKFDENYNKLTLKNNLPENQTIKKLHFMIGLDSAENHGDPSQWPNSHPLDPLYNHMHWTWASGYIFQVVEGYYMNNGNNQAIFSFHMANLNFRKNISITLNNAMSLKKGDKKTLQIKADFAKYFNSPNEYGLKTNGSNSHSTSQEELMRMNLLYENLSSVFSSM
jgi:hypothetical protein